MTLTHTDYDNIKSLFNTTGQIYYYYCKLIKLAKDNQINNNSFNTILKKLENWENIENNIIKDLCENVDKIKLVMDEIDKMQLNNNPYIKVRILNKLDKQLSKFLYKKISFKQDNDIFINLQQNYLIQNEYKLILSHDLFNIAQFLLDQEIVVISNSYIKSQLIEYKFKSLFISLDSSKDIINYINNNKITLGFDFTYDFFEYIRNINHNENEKEMVKNLFIKIKLLEYANKLLSINDSSISNEDELVNIIILKSHIKACTYLLSTEQKEHIIDELNKKFNNSISKCTLIEILKESIKLNTTNIKLKIK